MLLHDYTTPPHRIVAEVLELILAFRFFLRCFRTFLHICLLVILSGLRPPLVRFILRLPGYTQAYAHTHMMQSRLRTHIRADLWGGCTH